MQFPPFLYDRAFDIAKRRGILYKAQMTSRFLLACILLTSLAAAREPWVTQTGIASIQVQPRLESFAAPGYGLVPEQISGYEEDGTVRFAVLWGPRRDSIPRLAVHGLTASALMTHHASRQASGWRLIWINGYRFEGTDYYNVIYRQSSGAAQVLRLGDTPAEHQNAATTLTSSGHYLENLSVHSVGLLSRYASIWNASQGGLIVQSAVAYDLTPAQLETEIASRSAT